MISSAMNAGAIFYASCIDQGIIGNNCSIRFQVSNTTIRSAQEPGPHFLETFTLWNSKFIIKQSFHLIPKFAVSGYQP